jgi:hypothetical protein
VWPQCWDLQGPRGLEQRDLTNLNLGDLKKGPKKSVKKRKALTVTDRGGPWGGEASMLPHFLHSGLTEDDEVVSLKVRPPFTLRKIPGTHFY